MEDCAIAAKGGDEVDFGEGAQGRGGEGENGEAEGVLNLVGEGRFENERERGVGGFYVSVAGWVSVVADRNRDWGGGEGAKLSIFLLRKLNHSIRSRLRVTFLHYEDVPWRRWPAKRQEVIVLSLCECELQEPLRI